MLQDNIGQYGLMFQQWVKFLELAISDLSWIWTWWMHNISCSLNHLVKSMLQDNIGQYGPMLQRW